MPHTIRWSDVHLPSEWSLTSENQPSNAQHSLSDLDYIQQFNDGTVRINFQNSRINQNPRIQEVGNSSRHSFATARHSFVGSTTADSMSRRDSDLDKEIKNIRIRELEEELKKLKIKNIKTTSQVTYPNYTENELQNNSVTDEDQTSPTASDFLVTPPLNPQLSTLTQPFVINYSRLDKHLESNENILRRNLYRMKFHFMDQ